MKVEKGGRIIIYFRQKRFDQIVMQTGTKVTVNFLIFSGSKPAIQSDSILGLGSGYLYKLGEIELKNRISLK